jgi:S-adenosylmethionine hydrolase
MANPWVCKREILAGLAALLIVVGPGGLAPAQEAPAQKYPQTIVFMTDFGTVDDSVPICKGVMYSIMPEVRVVDLSHQVTPFSILDGARFLYGATPYFPSGTVFTVVIDPTVGSTRKAVIIKSKRDQYFVLPDNGLITLVADRDGLDAAREITSPAWMIGKALSSTFHGRDIFSPASAHVARGDDWTQVGPTLDIKSLVRLDLEAPKIDDQGLHGEIIATDGPFGNLVTNVDADQFLKLGYQRGQTVPITLGNKKLDVLFVKTFSDVPLKTSLIYIDSRGRFALAVNQGSFAATYGIKPPVKFTIARKQLTKPHGQTSQKRSDGLRHP